MAKDKRIWTTSRKDMDSFTDDGSGNMVQVVYLYPPDDEPRVAIFGKHPRKRAEAMAKALNAALKP